MPHSSTTKEGIARLKPSPEARQILLNGKTVGINFPFEIDTPVLFDISVDAQIYTVTDDRLVYRGDSAQPGRPLRWLPQGQYSVDWIVPRMALSPGYYTMRIELQAWQDQRRVTVANCTLPIEVQGDAPDIPPIRATWHFNSECEVDLEALPWQRGHDSWFFRHFDHAAYIVGDYMLDNSPLLKGRVLDVGCGDGITDLGIFLRHQPELLVGIDPDRGFTRLPQIIADNQLPVALPDNLIFTNDDANAIPYPDNHFDVVISWGSVEHIVGGYLNALKEIKRVLRPDGMLFIHPGLYYGNLGHHLGEFCSEPHFHLTRTHDELRELVLNTSPDLMDREGYEKVSPADFWRFYNELNPITVAQFEAELRELGFEFFRAALRTEGRIEYGDPRLQNYSIQELSTRELYLSAFNRK